MAQLFNGQANDGDSANLPWLGGAGTVFTKGTWDGAEIELVCKKDGVEIPLSYKLSFTENGLGNFQLGACDLLARQRNSGSSTSLDVFVESANGDGPG